MFNKYPYTDFHELNLDWILSKMHEIDETVNTFTAINMITYQGEWSMTNEYPKWSIVTTNNNSYLSIKPVPAGVDINNADYWLLIYSGAAALESITDSYAPTVQSRRVIALADSYGTRGDGLYELIQADAGITDMIIDAYGGRSFAKPTNTYLEAIQTQYLAVNNPDQITDIIVLGGYNDATYLYGGGSQTSLKNSIKAFIDWCLEHFINAKVYIGFVAWTRNIAGIGKTYINIALSCYREGAKYGAIYLNNVEYVCRNLNFLNNDAGDGFHPNAAGVRALAEHVYNAWISGATDVHYYNKIEDHFTAQLTTSQDPVVDLGLSLHNGLANMFGDNANSLQLRNSVSPYLGTFARNDWVALIEDTLPLFKVINFSGTCMMAIQYNGGTQKTVAVQFKYEDGMFYVKMPEAFNDVTILILQGISLTTTNDH